MEYNDLNEQQKAEVDALVRLGDNLELAIATVLGKQARDDEFYRNAYEG